MENLQLSVDDIKVTIKKYGTDTDHLWTQLSTIFNIASIARAFLKEKRTGVSVYSLFEISMALPLIFSGTVRGFFAGAFKSNLDCEQTSFYRFHQNSFINWRGVLFAFNRIIRALEKKEKLNEEAPKALILDDSPIPKSGRRIEGVSTIHDHCDNQYKTGYKLLGISWFNGTFARFIDFSLVSEKIIKIKTGKQFKKIREKASYGWKRTKELKTDKITLACQLISRAIKYGYRPDYILVDSWFTCKELINKVRSLNGGKIHFLGMVKHGRRKYFFEGASYTLNELRKATLSRKKRCARFKSRYIRVQCELDGVGMITIFFSRFHKRRKWVAILTTDNELTYTKALDVYAIRWNIEIGFKEAKQLLGLGKCQANDFDAQVAHMTAVFAAHAMLVWLKFTEQHASLGVLFKDIQEQHTTMLTMDKILVMLETLLCEIADSLGGAENITLYELLHAPEYARVKHIIGNSLIFGKNASLPQLPLAM